MSRRIFPSWDRLARNWPELTAPPLTTINYHGETAGFQAAKMLIDQLEGHQDGEKQILIPLELIVRVHGYCSSPVA